MPPDQLQQRVLFRDSNLIILDKPSGLAVHGGPKTPEHLEAMLGALRFNLSHAPRLVHRLDRDTSGCLLLARHDKAVVRLNKLFAAGQVTKTYWAVLRGEPQQDSGVIDLPLAKISSVAEGWRMVVDPQGASARSEWQVLGRGEGLCWVELRPKTGRTHQIRVHCLSGLGAAIVGDPVYGDGIGRLHLHARAVSVPYWAEREPVQAEAPPPEHMLAALRSCGYRD